jgi:hypothetical protein
MRTPENKVLLTGAGFTKNFGGLLADEMGDIIYNSQHLLKSPVRNILHNKSNYEDFYEEVLNGNFTNEEKKAAEDAIFEAYKKLDEVIRNFVYLANNVHLNGVNNLIDMFAGGSDKSGFCFTLNQDLFIERNFFGQKACLELPCIGRVPRHKNPLAEPLDYYTLPTEQGLSKKINDPINPLNSSNFYYIKLHGSFNWKSSDGSQQMVIGPGKEEQIGREPLLKWYNEIFSCILEQQDLKLLVIGYGFRDTHINRVISKAIEKNNLKLYVISPQNRVEFIKVLKQCAYGDVLSDNLEKYFPYDLFKIFPGDQSKTQAWKDIWEAIS